VSNNSIELKSLYYTHYLKGEAPMTKNEIELINIIRENDNPEQALQTAIDIILLSLVQPESYSAPSSASLQELA